MQKRFRSIPSADVVAAGAVPTIASATRGEQVRLPARTDWYSAPSTSEITSTNRSGDPDLTVKIGERRPPRAHRSPGRWRQPAAIELECTSSATAEPHAIGRRRPDSGMQNIGRAGAGRRESRSPAKVVSSFGLASTIRCRVDGCKPRTDQLPDTTPSEPPIR